MTHPNLTRAAQAIAAAILLFAAGQKFLGDPGSVEVFLRLGMEPEGRYIIGAIELVTAMLLLSPFAALGSAIAVGVMFGAVIAHTTQLGIWVHHDGGRMVAMMVVVLVCSSYVLYSRRREIPLVGDTFH